MVRSLLFHTHAIHLTSNCCHKRPQEVAEAELERGKAEEKMVTPPMSADLFKKTARVAELLEDKQRLDGIILVSGGKHPGSLMLSPDGVWVDV